MQKCLVETGNAPVIHFDDVGDVVIVGERIWYALYVKKPALGQPGQTDHELVAWVTGSLRAAPSILTRVFHILRPHKSRLPDVKWPAMLADHHH